MSGDPEANGPDGRGRVPASDDAAPDTAAAAAATAQAATAQAATAQAATTRSATASGHDDAVGSPGPEAPTPDGAGPEAPAGPTPPQAPDEPAGAADVPGASGPDGPADDAEPVIHGEWLERVPWYAVPAALLGIPLVAAILSAISQSFYDRVIFRYYWGPIKADGTEVHAICTQGRPTQLGDGHFLFWDFERWGCTDPSGVAATAGYNAVNTLSWVVLLFVCVVGAAQALHRLRVPMDAKMVVAATAWVITGSVYHVLQDSQLFEQPLEFAFITPPIWLIYAAFGVGSMALGAYFQYVQKETGSLERALQKAWFLLAIFVLGYTFLWLTDWDQVRFYVNPVYIAAFALVSFLALRLLAESEGTIQPWHCVATFSIGWFLLGVQYYIMYWLEPWPPRSPDDELRFAIWVVPLLALAVTAATYAVGRWLAAKGKEGALPFTRPINLLIVFSQMLDAFSTSVGVDLSSYEEKHVLSEAVRRGFQDFANGIGWEFGAAHPTFLGFAAVKLIVSLLVIYAIDVDAAKSGKRHPIMMNLIKLAVIMVGIGPGARNTLRMTLGI